MGTPFLLLLKQRETFMYDGEDEKGFHQRQGAKLGIMFSMTLAKWKHWKILPMLWIIKH